MSRKSGAPFAGFSTRSLPSRDGFRPDGEACVEACPDVDYMISDARTDLCFTGGVGQTTPAVGEFPAQFSLDILEPPPEEALITAQSASR